MLWFYLLVFGTFLFAGTSMAWFFIRARDVPDESEKNPQERRRLNPDQLRMLSYVLMTLVLLMGAMFEVYLFYG